MKILYIHGYQARFNLDAPKVIELLKLGEVVGLTIDYDVGQAIVERQLIAFAIFNDIELIVGSSLGGFYANLIGNQLELPFVCINPAIEPNVGNISSEFPKTGNGLILLEGGDTVIDAYRTYDLYNKHFQAHLWDGGRHSFTRLEKCLLTIKDFYNSL